jgi:DNA transformation protein and related proteins
MSRHGDFVDFVAEQVAFVEGLSIRAMFGGHALYRHGEVFAIVASGQLFFKADSVSESDFEAEGMRPFTYTARGKQVTLQYFEAPPEVFEEQACMRNWVQKACEAAARSLKSSKRTGKLLRHARRKPRPTE